MSKQIEFPQVNDMHLDDNIKNILDGSFPLPEKVENSKKEAFAKVRVVAAEKEGQEDKNDVNALIKRTKSRKNHRKMKKAFLRAFAGGAAAIAVLLSICMVNPAVAACIPIVNHVFEKMGDSLEFAGDYAKLAEPVENSESGTESITINGINLTLSETYCNEAALYLSFVIHSKEKFPETFIGQDGKPVIKVRSLIDFDFDEEGYIDLGNFNLDGEMADENIYAGVLRLDIAQYFAGTDIEIPENYQVKLTVSQIIGDKLEDTIPEMPKELREQYEDAMKENGLGLTDADFEQFTEEQKDIEHQLFSNMWNAYYERYPEKQQYPNKYQNWWMDGPWDFTFDVTRNNEDVIRKEINELDENGLGLLAVTKTPVEITVETEDNIDYFVVVLDADGNLMEHGGDFNTVAISGHDTSKIDVYICDYIEYMDELKGYWWSNDYEERAKEKTFKQLLDERCLYHKEIAFEF